MVYDNITTIVDVWKDTNTVTDGLYSYLFLLCIFLISFIALKQFDKKVVFVSSSFLTTFVCIILFLAELTTTTAVTVCITMLVVSLFVQMFRGE